MLGAAAVGFVLELRRRGHSSGEEAGDTDTAIVVTAAAGVLSGLILLVLGVASDSRPTLYESIGLAALTGLLLIVFHRFFPAVERHDAAGVPSTWAESALARVPAGPCPSRGSRPVLRRLLLTIDPGLSPKRATFPTLRSRTRRPRFRQSPQPMALVARP